MSKVPPTGFLIVWGFGALLQDTTGVLQNCPGPLHLPAQSPTDRRYREVDMLLTCDKL